MTKSKQNWEVGSQVKIGFGTYTVEAPSSCGWFVTAKNGTRYEFQPHVGLYRCD